MVDGGNSLQHGHLDHEEFMECPTISDSSRYRFPIISAPLAYGAPPAYGVGPPAYGGIPPAYGGIPAYPY